MKTTFTGARTHGARFVILALTVQLGAAQSIDNSSWMEDRLHGYRCQTLTSLTLPASHDSAMFQTGTPELDGVSLSTYVNGVLAPFRDVLEFVGLYDDVRGTIMGEINTIARNLARTQDLTIGQQLDYGIRIFNLRPKWYGGNSFVLHHSVADIKLQHTVNMPRPFDDIHINIPIGDMSVNGPSLDAVLADIRDFMAAGHRELVILRVDHYWTEGGFNGTAYANMQIRFQEALAPWLLTSDQIPPGLNLQNTPLWQLIGDQGRVVLLCGDGPEWAFTDPSIGIWPAGALTAGGAYSNTDSESTMRAVQSTRFETNIAPRFSLSWTLTVQVGVDAINDSVRSLAAKINPDLWDFVAGLVIPNANGNVINEIWADFVEDTDVTILAIVLNNQCPDCHVVAPAIVGTGEQGVVLDGSASTDPDGDELMYFWEQTAGPTNIVLEDVHSPVARFDVPLSACGAVYKFTLTVMDERGAACHQTVEVAVVDVTQPVLECNVPDTITPPQAPITFTATATDNCDEAPTVTITDYACYKINGNGRLIDLTRAARVAFKDGAITLLNTGGVGTHHVWRVEATDARANSTASEFHVEVVIPGRNK